MTTKNLLVELFVEELPPKVLEKLGLAFKNFLFDSLQDQNLIDHQSLAETSASPGDVGQWYATPRRLATLIPAVMAISAVRSQKLMPVSVGIGSDNKPTPALVKRLKTFGLGIEGIDRLTRRMEGKSETLFIDLPGISLVDGLQKALEETLAKLPIPKLMSYQLADGWTSVSFVRPAHSLVVLHGTDVIPVSILGLTAGRLTRGHTLFCGAQKLKSNCRKLQKRQAPISNQSKTKTYSTKSPHWSSARTC